MMNKKGKIMSSSRVTFSLSERSINILNELVETKGMKKSAIISLVLDEYYKKERRQRQSIE